MIAELAVFTGEGRSPASIRAWMDYVNEMRRSVLVEGVDYMRIPKTPKPCLLQAGAEKLLMLSGLGFEMERVEVTSQGVTYRCTVPGRSMCEGYAGRDEPNLKQAPWNTVVKMAQKRAKVGAISSALALSGLFTQDLEDLPPGNGAQGEPATAPAVPVHETSGGDTISTKAAKLALIDAYEEVGYDYLQAKMRAGQLWDEHYGYTTIGHVSKVDLQVLLNIALESGEQLALAE